LKITDIKDLEKIANNIRIDIINQVYEANSGHPGGAPILQQIFYQYYTLIK